jgi:hypothetical protein
VIPGPAQSFFKTAVIGDFPKAQAKEFFMQQLNIPSMTDENWNAVYEVCIVCCIVSHALILPIMELWCHCYATPT